MNEDTLVDFDALEKRALIYKQEAIDKLTKTLAEAGYRVIRLSNGGLTCDYKIPNEQLKFYIGINIELIGWEQSPTKAEAGA